MSVPARLLRLGQEIFNRPLAIAPDYAQSLTAALSEHVTIAELATGTAVARILAGGAYKELAETDWDGNESDDPGYDVCEGVAVISIEGTLLHRLGMLRPFWGYTGYDGVDQALKNALRDEKVKGIVLDIDSPGGMVSGLFDLGQAIAAAGKIKPIRAILDDTAYSAAYLLAAAAPGGVTVPQAGGTGSIGAVCMHVDLSQALEKNGVKVTLVQYGARKTDYSPYKPLANAALKRLQADIDTVGEMFVGAVAQYRDLEPAALRDTEAGLFFGAAGVEAGLADEVMTPAASFEDFLAQLS